MMIIHDAHKRGLLLLLGKMEEEEIDFMSFYYDIFFSFVFVFFVRFSLVEFGGWW